MQATFFGLSRAGNHAIIHWVASHLAGTTVFRNCVGLDGACDMDVYRDGHLVETWPRGQARSVPSADHTIQSYENDPPPSPATCLVLRDPLNWLASRAKHLLLNHGEPRVEVSRWVQFARSCIDTDAVVASYPEWFLSRAYRDRLAERLGLQNRDLGGAHWDWGSRWIPCC